MWVRDYKKSQKRHGKIKAKMALISIPFVFSELTEIEMFHFSFVYCNNIIYGGVACNWLCHLASNRFLGI